MIIFEKYKLEASILPERKKIFFDCTKLQYRKWSTQELQRWLSTARKIIQRYKLNLKKKVRTKLKPTSNSTIDTNNNIHAPTTPLTHLFIKDKKTNHFKNTTINKYFNCITSPKHTSPPTISIPSETEHKIAYVNLDKNNNPDVNIVIPTVPIQDPTYKQNNHQEIPSQIPYQTQYLYLTLLPYIIYLIPYVMIIIPYVLLKRRYIK